MKLYLCFFYICLVFCSCEAAEVNFIYKNPGPKQHFSDFQKLISNKGISADVFSIDEWERSSKEAGIVITEGGHLSFASLHRELEKLKLKHFLYYDNFEAFVPGGYSSSIALVLKEKLNGVLFANENLVSRPIFSEPGRKIKVRTKKIGIGYYTYDKVEELRLLRKQKLSLRKAFLEKHKIADVGQPIYIFLGASNAVYYKDVFPAFLTQINHLADGVCVLQPHPRSFAEKNSDITLLTSEDPVIVSKEPMLNAFALADAIFYFQSSVVPQILLAGIPLIQFAPEPYEDIFVREKIITSIVSLEGWHLKSTTAVAQERVLSLIGFNPEWEKNLETFIKSNLDF